MKTKSNENKKNKNAMAKAEQPLAIRVGPAQRTVIAVGRSLAPRASIKDLIHLGRALAKRAREGGEEREREALADLLAACELGDDALAYNAATEASGAGKQREDVVVQASAMKGLLTRWANGTTGVAKAAAEVQRKLFPADEQYNRMSQGTLWQLMAMKANLLQQDVELRGALAVFVPEAATAELFAKNDALGASLPRNAGELITPVDVTALVATLRAHTQRYAAAVIAAVHPDDEDAVRRAVQALQPLVELRAEQRNRRRNLAKAKASAAADAVAGMAPPVVEPAVDDEGDDTG